MPTLDSSMKRFLAIAMAPLFLFLNGKFGAGVDGETQRMLLELIGAYFVTSKGGEAIIVSAKAKAAAVTQADVQGILARANAEGAKLAPTVAP